MKITLRFHILVLFGVPCLYSGIINPPIDTQINATIVQFRWDAIVDVSSYRLQISTDNNFTQNVSTFETDRTYYIVSGLEWDESYYWKVNDENGTNILSDIGNFTTGKSYSSFLNEPIPGPVGSTVHNASKISDGYTIVGSYLYNFSAAFDNWGNEVWNSGSADSFVYFNRSDDGELLGGVYSEDYEYLLSGGSVDIYTNLIFHENDNAIFEEDGFLQHEILKLPNGNYLSLAPDIRLGPIPTSGSEVSFPWEEDFEDIGFNVDGETFEFEWLGEKLVEWDPQTNDTLWTFSSFEMFSFLDYDILGGIWNNTANDMANPFDWTHFNAIAFSENENAIYLSSRHLSKITKIDYDTKEILWNVGYDQQSMYPLIQSVYGFNPDTSFIQLPLLDENGNYNSFSFQHGLQILENGNIVTLDNGNLSSYIFDDYTSPRTRAVEIAIDEVYMTAEIIWEYILPVELYSAQSGNVQKLENGNYLITVTADGGTSWEVTEDKELVWECKFNLRDGDGPLYRAHKYEDFFNTFTCEGELEADICGICGGDNSSCDITLSNSDIQLPHSVNIHSVYPNPFNPILNAKIEIDNPQHVAINIYNLQGHLIENVFDDYLENGIHNFTWNASTNSSGIYLLKVATNSTDLTQKVILLK